MNEKISVRMFSSFAMESNKVCITEEDLHSNKVTALLVYMILNRTRVVEQLELLDVLFPKKSKNPAGALKNLIYRVRTAVKPILSEELIVTVSGGYRWNPDVTVELDCDRFEHLYELIMKDTEAGKNRILNCNKAIKMFGNNLTERIAGELWSVPVLEKYRSMYIQIVKLLGEYYESNSDWEMLEGLMEGAEKHAPLDEDIQYMLIRSLTGLKKYDRALKQYEEANNRGYAAYGIHVSDRLRTVFHEIFEQHGSKELSIQDLIDELDDTYGKKAGRSGGAQKKEGAFICDYQVFRQIYRVEKRRLARSGMSEYITFVTIRPKVDKWDTEEEREQKIKETMDSLEKLLYSKLRAGDVISRYNMSQFLIMLPSCNAEQAELVMRRVKKIFVQNIGRQVFDFRYEIEAVSADV